MLSFVCLAFTRFIRARPYAAIFMLTVHRYSETQMKDNLATVHHTKRARERERETKERKTPLALSQSVVHLTLAFARKCHSDSGAHEKIESWRRERKTVKRKCTRDVRGKRDFVSPVFMSDIMSGTWHTTADQKFNEHLMAHIQENSVHLTKFNCLLSFSLYTRKDNASGKRQSSRFTFSLTNTGEALCLTWNCRQFPEREKREKRETPLIEPPLSLIKWVFVVSKYFALHTPCKWDAVSLHTKAKVW